MTDNKQQSQPAPRTLPHNLEAERSVLGAILIDNDVWADAALAVTSADFFRDGHARAYRALERAKAKGLPMDLVTLKEELDATGDLDEAGGPAYLASLVDGVPRSTNVEYYAGIVREKARLRGAIFAANKIIADAYQAGEQSAILIVEHGVQELLKVADAGVVGERSAAQAVDAYTKTITSEKSAAFLTGLIDVDTMTGGFERKKLTIVAARPSVGKSSLITSIADNVSGRGEPVGMITLEMDDETLAGNLVAAHSGVSSDRVRRRLIKDREWAHITDALGVVSERPIYFVNAASTIMQVSAWARRLREKYGIRLLFLDYLQLLGDPKARDRQSEVAAISKGLKRVAKEEDMAIVALSAIGRDSEKRMDKRPALSDLRESGAIEFDADLVLLLFREAMHKPNDESLKGIAEIIIAKNRGGPVGTVKVAFINETAKWCNLVVGGSDGLYGGEAYNS